MLFLIIRGETIKFLSYLNKKQKLLEMNLKNDIDWLESNSNQSNISLLEDRKTELENTRKDKIKGYITRARIQWLNQGEKPTSFFCKLESKHSTEKTIRKLQIGDGATINDQKLILKEIEKYYHNLFKVKVGVLRPVQQPGSYGDRSSELPLVGLEPTEVTAYD